MNFINVKSVFWSNLWIIRMVLLLEFRWSLGKSALFEVEGIIWDLSNIYKYYEVSMLRVLFLVYFYGFPKCGHVLISLNNAVPGHSVSRTCLWPIKVYSLAKYPLLIAKLISSCVADSIICGETAPERK